MRISDWSSDVCSSDLENLELFDADDSGRRVTKPLLALDDATLLVGRPGIHDRGRRLLAQDMETSVDRQIVILRHVDLGFVGEPVKVAPRIMTNLAADNFIPVVDRNSAVTGKSESVRVDLVGRRILTKKKNRQIKNKK